MLFNSIEFVIFFPLVTLLYFLLPHRFRWAHLLAASCVFYMFFVPIYILILAFTIVVDYCAGILIESAAGKSRKMFLVMSLAANIGVLSVFKYYNFFNENLTQAAHFLNVDYALPALSILLPVGLSFHTFQAMSYTIEVYRGRQKAERHFGIYALYVMFYPQLVAGPIERPQNLLPQFYERHEFDARRVSDGLKLMLWGMFKKVVVADRLAIFVDAVYNQPPQKGNALVFVVAMIFFAFQAYCDFSGYTDIAIGAAQVMGFKLMKNFDRPFRSQSIAEFWTRWHISLSTWFRDYLYIPLGGNRGSKFSWYFNVFFTFLISGVWHGAGWTFIIWGALNGIYLLVSIWTARLRSGFVERTGLSRFPNLHRYIKIAITFGLTAYAMMFFRSNSFSDALDINKLILSSFLHPLQTLAGAHTPILLRDFILSLAAIVVLQLVETAQGERSIKELFGDKPLAFRYAIYYALILAIFLFGEFNNRQFIYFQF